MRHENETVARFTENFTQTQQLVRRLAGYLIS